MANVRAVIRRKHLSYATEKCYCGWIARYSRYVLRLDPKLESERKFEAFLTSLAKDGMSATTQNQAFNAILFLYRDVRRQQIGDVQGLRAKGRSHVRHAPSLADTAALLDAVADIHGYPTRLITHLLYGCGLRVSEPLNLRIKDVHMDDSRLVIREAKGGKDRVVRLPDSVMTDLRDQIKRARLIWDLDQSSGVPVPLPDKLGKKYRGAEMSWSWAWLFPSKSTCHHPRTGQVVRWRCHESNVQRAVRAAALRLGLESGITPHHLRHAYATHALDAGANVRDVQAALGHKSLETTMIYVHSHAERVRSPLDLLQKRSAS